MANITNISLGSDSGIEVWYHHFSLYCHKYQHLLCLIFRAIHVTIPPHGYTLTGLTSEGNLYLLALYTLFNSNKMFIKF